LGTLIRERKGIVPKEYESKGEKRMSEKRVKNYQEIFKFPFFSLIIIDGISKRSAKGWPSIIKKS
jgi:hypothetical protein